MKWKTCEWWVVGGRFSSLELKSKTLYANCMSKAPDNLSCLRAFATVAEEYCVLIESLGQNHPTDLFSQLESLLMRIHQAILPTKMGMGRTGIEQRNY